MNFSKHYALSKRLANPALEVRSTQPHSSKERKLKLIKLVTTGYGWDEQNKRKILVKQLSYVA